MDFNRKSQGLYLYKEWIARVMIDDLCNEFPHIRYIVHILLLVWSKSYTA